jgi:outer membrane protein assembly factor BamB
MTKGSRWWLALFCGAWTFSHAADWPQFRGPNGQGHSEVRGLPTRWSDVQNVAWKQELPGAGWSSPVISGERLYLTTAVGADGGALSLRALCLDTHTGKTLWSKEVLKTTPVPAHQKNSHASPTPIAEGERLYVHFGQYGTAALDLRGNVLWTNASLKYPPVHGNGGSPALVGDALIFSCDGAQDPFIAALNKNTGAVLWRTPRNSGAKKPFSFSTPLAIEVGGATQLVSPASGGVFAYDPKTGKELWRVRYPEGYSVVPRPVFGHGLVFVSSSFDNAVLYAIRPDGRGDVTDSHIAWSLNKSAPKTPSPLLVGNELYFVSDAGVMSCVDARTGKIHWQERVGGNYSASPVFADGKIYVQSEEGVGTVVKPGTNFEVLAKNDVKERTLASYALDEGVIYIRTAKHLLRVQEPTPTAAK